MYLKCRNCGNICKVIVCPKCSDTCILKFDSDEERDMFRSIYYRVNGNVSVHKNRFEPAEIDMIKILIDIKLLKSVGKHRFAKAETKAWTDIWMDMVEKIG
jgi:hypothetical protein